MMPHQPIGKVCNCNERGWMPGIEHVPIRWARPDYMLRDAGLMEPYVIVDHIAQGYIRTIDAWASNGQSKIITHFGAERGGRKVQYQDIYTEGIHTSGVSGATAALVVKYGSVAGRGVNPYSVGIEHEGFSVDPGYGFDYLYSRARPWPEPMVLASIEIKRWIFAQPDTNLGAPSRDTIIGHYEADARSRINDPAPAADRSIWPRDRMVAALTPAPPPAGSLWTAADTADINEIERRVSEIRRRHEGS